MERVKGIEPSYEAWEAAVLPLNYTRELRILAEVFERTPAAAYGTFQRGWVRPFNIVATRHQAWGNFGRGAHKRRGASVI